MVLILVGLVEYNARALEGTLDILICSPSKASLKEQTQKLHYMTTIICTCAIYSDHPSYLRIMNQDEREYLNWKIR